MSIQQVVNAWNIQPEITSNIVATRKTPARLPNLVEPPVDLHPYLLDSLKSLGISALYTHQVETWTQYKKGRNVVIVTGTASGKSLAYNLPVIDRLLKDPDARSLYIHPTKALSQDQLSLLFLIKDQIVNQEESQFPYLEMTIYDGDTPKNIRRSIRQNARILLTNPDMLHLGILPHHTNWVNLFSNLQIIVIDEIHIYRGVFGSHFANLLRRLKRILKFYGSFPKFILTSATIANPLELAENIVEEKFELVDVDGSGRGQQLFVIYNPPIVNRELGLRRSALQESVKLARDLFTFKNQTIIFGRSRRTVELILKYLRQRLIPSNSGAIIRGYRSGYLPEQRREIETGLRDGAIRTVVATNALELGIDIGEMNAAVLVGYPGSISSTIQQAGRAGRGNKESIAVLITTPDPLDQFLAKHPKYLFESSPENALINPDNLLILMDHLKCAVFELPFQEDINFGKVDQKVLIGLLEILSEQGLLHKSNHKYFWMADKYPSQDISLRSASAENVALQASIDGIPVIIGHVDISSAHWLVHPQAIYLHEASTYYVEDLDLDRKIALLEPIDTDYFTEPQRESDVSLVELYNNTEIIGGEKYLGDILVKSQVVGYRKIKLNTHEQIGLGKLSLPSTELLTKGYWFSLDNQTISHLRELDLWRDDPIYYGPNWKSIRDQVRQRDRYRCQSCGIQETNREHDIHHIKPFRTFTSFESANRLDNLTTLCKRCHQRAETIVKVGSGLSGVSYVLRHLAPLFLMCDVRDISVLSDVKSKLAGGMPSVVVFEIIPAGIGFSEHLYDIHYDLLKNAYQLVAECDCFDGCPSCVGPGGDAGVGSKEQSQAILSLLMEAN